MSVGKTKFYAMKLACACIVIIILLNPINSEKRDSLNGHSPYEVSRLLLDNRLHKALGLAEIPADEVTLIPALIK